MGAGLTKIMYYYKELSWELYTDSEMYFEEEIDNLKIKHSMDFFIYFELK